jgi:diguanylate cyclase (GGDEF)-like protein
VLQDKSATPSHDGAAEGEAQRLRAALAAAREVAYEWDLANDRVNWFGDLAALFCVKPEDVPQTITAFRRMADWNFVNDISNIFDGLTKEQGYESQFAVEGADHKVRWFEARARLSLTQNGPARAWGVLRDITHQKRTEARLEYLAGYDELTGHLNRTRLRQALDAALDTIRREDQNGAYLIICIDHLSLINDTYGHDIADQVIVATGNRIASLIKEGEVIGRSAGNKFGVVLPHRSRDEILEFGRTLREMMRSSIIETKKGAVCVTVSVGAVRIPSSAQTSEEAMARAEEALDQAKRLGRDAFRLFEHSEHRDSLRRRTMSIADQVVNALNDRRIVLAYQPVVCAKTGKVSQYECLLRMIQPDGHIVPAGEFIAVTERVGLIGVIDQRALELAVDTLSVHPDVRLALNISGMTASNGAWLEGFLAHIRAYREIASRLTFELTETAALHDVQITAEFMANIRQLGCRVSIDDFGAGYTSFRNLQLLEIDSVKIDGSFIAGIVDSPDNQLFVRTLVNLASNFGVSTVAECVGDGSEAALLRSFGVDYFQGYYFGRPEVNPAWLKKAEMDAQRLQA